MCWVNKKCSCEDTQEANHVTFDDGCILEYDIICKECNSILRHWAYGFFDYEG